MSKELFPKKPVRLFLTGPLYRGNSIDLQNFERAIDIIESAGKNRFTVCSVHDISEGLAPEELADKDHLFRLRVRMMSECDLFVALDNFEQDYLSKAEVNYLRASGFHVMTMSKFIADAELRQPEATGA
jgi:nucleoside 2-deoxyribosyltransferase